MKRAQKTAFGVYEGDSVVEVENFVKCVFGRRDLKKRKAKMVGMLDDASD